MTEDKPKSEDISELDKEELQQKYQQFQMLQQQIEQASQQLEMLNQQLIELDISLEAVEELEKTTLNNEVLASIAPGIFVKTSLKENKKLIVNVGANTAAEKTTTEVIELLEKQKEQFEKNVTRADSMLQMMSQQAMQLYQEFEKLQ